MNAEGLVSPAAKLDRYTDGQLICCTGKRAGLRCTHYVCAVPPDTVATARRIRVNSDAAPGTLSYQCKHCKALTEVRAEPAVVAS